MTASGLPVLVVTGAAGGVGTALLPRLSAQFQLRLLDRTSVSAPPDGTIATIADIAVRDDLVEAFTDADAVLHLAGERRPIASWDELVRPNLIGQETVLEVASELGVPRVVLASSCHASGRYDVDNVPHIDPSWAPRPCCRYGITKAFGETAGRLYAETTGTSVIALRLGAVSPEPVGRMGLAFWLSLADLELVTLGALRTDVRHGVYFAASANASRRWNMSAGESDLGFVPQDDAYDHLDDIDVSLPVQPCYLGASL